MGRFSFGPKLPTLSSSAELCHNGVKSAPPPTGTFTPSATGILATAEGTRQHQATLEAGAEATYQVALEATRAYHSTVSAEAKATYTAKASAGPATQAAYAATHVTGDVYLGGSLTNQFQGETGGQAGEWISIPINFTATSPFAPVTEMRLIPIEPVRQIAKLPSPERFHSVAQGRRPPQPGGVGNGRVWGALACYGMGATTVMLGS